MEITVSSKNEFPFYPEIGSNLSLPVADRFTVLVKKVNGVMSSSRWSKVSTDGNFNIDFLEKVKSQVIRIENPPTLIDEGRQIKLTIDILLSDRYVELFDIQNQIFDFINKLESEGRIETKKS